MSGSRNGDFPCAYASRRSAVSPTCTAARRRFSGVRLSEPGLIAEIVAQRQRGSADCASRLTQVHVVDVWPNSRLVEERVFAIVCRGVVGVVQPGEALDPLGQGRESRHCDLHVDDGFGRDSSNARRADVVDADCRSAAHFAEQARLARETIRPRGIVRNKLDHEGAPLPSACCWALVTPVPTKDRKRKVTW